MSFAEKVKQHRQTNGLTQAQFADSLGISSQTISNWESGRSEPSQLVQKLLSL